MSTALPARARIRELGSGTDVVNVTSSIVKEPPDGAPRISTLEIPPEELTCISLLGLLPGTPERPSLFEKRELAESTKVFEELKASSVSGTEYVKNASKLDTAVENAMVIGPPLSIATLTPDLGGNSNSLSETPEVAIVAFEKMSPAY